MSTENPPFSIVPLRCTKPAESLANAIVLKPAPKFAQLFGKVGSPARPTSCHPSIGANVGFGTPDREIESGRDVLVGVPGECLRDHEANGDQHSHEDDDRAERDGEHPPRVMVEVRMDVRVR
jgi:hypothetical protein